MAYAERDKVREVISRTASSRPGTAASLSDEQVDEAIAAAARQVDAELGRVFAVPFGDPVPALITDITEALAAFDLDMTFRETRSYPSELHPVMIRRNQALAMLKKLREGTADLPDYEPPPSGPDPEQGDSGSVVAVFNPCLVDLYPNRSPAPEDVYYGWTL